MGRARRRGGESLGFDIIYFGRTWYFDCVWARSGGRDPMSSFSRETWKQSYLRRSNGLRTKVNSVTVQRCKFCASLWHPLTLQCLQHKAFLLLTLLPMNWNTAGLTPGLALLGLLLNYIFKILLASLMAALGPLPGSRWPQHKNSARARFISIFLDAAAGLAHKSALH